MRSCPVLVLVCALGCAAGEIRWVHLSSSKGDLPAPGTSTEQTGLLAVRIDKDSPATDFVVSCRQAAPALIWYRHIKAGWSRYVVEKEFLRIEAGGAAFDIDHDGDLDVVFGDDASGNRLYWWENPYPHFDPGISWKRHTIKSGGANQHHDQVFADLKGTGAPQLVFWNQKAKTLFLSEIPAGPRHAESWPLETIFSGQAGEDVKSAAKYAEGIDAFDVDGDGRPDLLAGNFWFRRESGGRFLPVQVSEIGGRIRAGKFKRGKYAQIVIGPGDGTGPLMFLEASGDPAEPSSWRGRNLLGRDLVHGHTLDAGDIDGDGNLDIFAAEMARWTKKPGADYPDATAWILYGDGRGNFRITTLVRGNGWHEGKLADVDGDGDLDIINKPYAWETPRVDLWLNQGSPSGRTRRRE
ncbi:MAG: VCBS repeat-containing protein [Bryobacterales bacterium]|nr:VCBS repeat-containing protein [Bryobacterales bacterium]